MQCFEARGKADRKPSQRPDCVLLWGRTQGAAKPCPPSSSRHSMRRDGAQVSGRVEKARHPDPVEFRLEALCGLGALDSQPDSRPAQMESKGRDGRGRNDTTPPYGKIIRTPCPVSFRQGGLVEQNVISRVTLQRRKHSSFF